MISIPSDLIAETLHIACTLQQIPGPTFHEEARAAFMQEQFQQLGLLDIHNDAQGNVLARFPGKKAAKPLIVSAHLDTVHPLDSNLTLQHASDRIIGRSIGDNSLGLAALISLVRLLHMYHPQLPGDVWLVANVGEEGLGNLLGIQAIVDRFTDQALAYLIIEGMGVGGILHRGLGVERYRISFQTPGGHSWVNYGLPSAIHELCALINRLTALSIPSSPATSLNVGVIQGGTSVNTIAANASMELDLRSEDSLTLAHLVAEVNQLVIASKKHNVQPTMEQIGKRLAGSLPSNHALVKLATTVLKELGFTPHLDIGSTDANLPLSRGYPAICIGITQGNNAHAADEYILTEPVAAGITQLYEIVLRSWSALR